MKTIYKFPLQMKTEQQIAAPEGAEVLSVGVQHGQPVVWMLVDPNATLADLTIRTHGTGHNTTDNPGRFIGTIQLAEGSLILHVFAAN